MSSELQRELQGSRGCIKTLGWKCCSCKQNNGDSKSSRFSQEHERNIGRVKIWCGEGVVFGGNLPRHVIQGVEMKNVPEAAHVEDFKRISSDIKQALNGREGISVERKIIVFRNTFEIEISREKDIMHGGAAANVSASTVVHFGARWDAGRACWRASTWKKEYCSFLSPKMSMREQGEFSTPADALAFVRHRLTLEGL